MEVSLDHEKAIVQLGFQEETEHFSFPILDCPWVPQSHRSETLLSCLVEMKSQFKMRTIDEGM